MARSCGLTDVLATLAETLRNMFRCERERNVQRRVVAMTHPTLRDLLDTPRRQGRLLGQRIHDAGDRPHPQGGELRSRRLRHGAFGLRLRDDPGRLALRRGGGARNHRPPAVEALPRYRAGTRYRRQIADVPDGRHAGRSARHRRVHEIPAARHSRRHHAAFL